MKIQLVDSRLSGVLVVSALIAAAAVDVTYSSGHPWVLAAYTLPVLLCARLPVLGIVLGVSAVFSVLLGVALATDSLPQSPPRIVALLETLLISGFVLYFRATRDALQLSDERVAGILDGSDTGFVRMTRDLVIRDVNGPWLRMVRARQHQDVIGTRLTDWFPPERRRSAEAMLGFLDEGARRSFEAEMRPLLGPLAHTVVTAYAEREGDEVLISAVFADVTAIRHAEAEARASSEQLRLHLERTPLAAVVLDEDHRILEWNDAAERIFGWRRAQALGMSAWSLVPPAHRGSRIAPFGDPDTTARSGGYERSEQVRGDGRQVLVQWYHTPLPGPDGVVRRFASLGLDVTRQQETEEALRVSEAKFASVFHESPDALLLVRLRDNALLEANRAVERVFGWTPRALEQTWSTFDRYWESAEDRVWFAEKVREADFVEAFETRVRAADGTERSVLLSARRLRVGGQGVLLLTVRDFTAIRDAEIRRRELEQQLQQAQRLEGIGRLAGGVAHDFNNMLAGVQGYAELIEVQSSQSSQVEHYAARILETTRRAADLVGKLLTFSRQGAMQKRYFDVGQVVSDTLDLLEQTLGAAVRLERRLDARVVAVLGDESQISNALLNLCVNARDAVGKGGRIIVSTSLAQLDDLDAGRLDPELAAGDYVVLRVQDDGCGISAEALENIFVPFFTTKADGKGTGLGLPSVYGAAKGHGGTVQVDSQPGRGSTFSLWLPASPASSIPADARKGVAPPRLEGRSVLVIDDEMSVRDTLARSLQGLGCKVEVAAEGREGLVRFKDRAEEWDLVLLDVDLPELSGEDVYSAIAMRRPRLPVILMSGYDRTARMQRMRSDGAAGALEKPFTRDQLHAELARVLAGAPAPLRIVRSD